MIESERDISLPKSLHRVGPALSSGKAKAKATNGF
jgi:hypothetical protein